MDDPQTDSGTPVHHVSPPIAEGPRTWTIFSDAWRFVRDVFWLFGWGASRIGEGARHAAEGTENRGAAGCLAVGAAILAGLMFWRRRKPSHRKIRHVKPAKTRSDVHPPR